MMRDGIHAQSSAGFHDDEDRAPRSLGCSNCDYLQRCGGLHTNSPIWNCLDFCTCVNKQECKRVCRSNTAFPARLREIGGLSLHTTPRSTHHPMPTIPDVAHRVHAGRSFQSKFDIRAAYVSLYKLIRRKSVGTRFKTAQELADYLGIRVGTPIIVTGVGADHDVEGWWKRRDRHLILRNLVDLGVTLIAVPNFSLTVDAPREDDFHAMKRIALCHAEAQRNGLPAGLHLNARTEQDYAGWSEFINSRTEVSSVSFEFATDCGDGSRKSWHLANLVRLAESVERPLTLLVRGGGANIGTLCSAYHRVILLDSDAYMKTVKRQRATFSIDGRLRWRAVASNEGQSLDELFADNSRAVQTRHKIITHGYLRAA